MIPHTYPTFMDAQKKAYMKVFFLSSVSGLTKWIDYIPVKTVAFSATNEGTTNTGGHMTVTQVASDTALAKWRDYIPVYEDASATVAWSSNANGYIPVCQLLSLDFTAGIIDSRITFTRADAVTCATYFDSTGRLATVAANVARFDYDPATLLPRGLLIEESRKNNLLHSRDMTQAAWTKTDTTPTRNQVGLDGVANTATLLTEGSAGTAQTNQTGATITAGSALSGSFVVKRGNTDWIRVMVSDSAATALGQCWFNLNTGVKGSVASVTATGVSGTMVPLGGGWYRCIVSMTQLDGVTTAPWIRIISASADNSATRVANATYIVDCAQLEVGAFATSIIPCGATALTRAADSASMTGANFSSWFNASAGTFVAEVDQPLAPPAGAYAMYGASDNTANNFIGHRFDTSGTGDSATAITGGVNQTSLSGTGITVGSVVKAAHSYDATGRSASRNGGTVRTQAGYTLPTLTQLGIGNYPSANALNGHIRSLRYYPTRLANATLQALTA